MIALLQILICFRKGDFFRDLKEVEQGQKRDGNREEAIELLRIMMINARDS